MVILLTILHIFICLFLILVVLLQAGKGGGMGLAFGGAGSQSVFGGSGAGNFLTRLTAIVASSFMVTSLLLAYFSSDDGADWAVQLRKEQQIKDEARKKAEAALIPDGGPAVDVTASGDGGAAELPPGEPPVPMGEPGGAPPAPADVVDPATKTEPPKPASAPKADPAPKAAPAPKVDPTPAPKKADPAPAPKADPAPAPTP